MKFNSIRFKTNILYTVILGAILTVFSGIIFFEARTLIYRDLDESLQIKAKEVGDILRVYEQTTHAENRPLNFLMDLFRNEEAVFSKQIIDDLWYSQVKTLNLKNDYIHILTPGGRLTLSSSDVGQEEEKLFREQLPLSSSNMFFRDLKDDNHYLRAINFPLLYNDRVWLVIQIGTPLAHALHPLKKLSVFIILTVGFILILTSFLGSIFARSVLGPVREIAETADRISHKNLHIQIEERQSDEEIRFLIKSFNTMLSRLESSFTHINEFSSHVAHELKTPLAILRGEMELALNENRSAEEYKKVLITGMEEVNRLIKIIKDLLLLANLDYRTDIYHFEKISLSAFLQEICENGKLLASEKSITVTSDIPAAEAMIDGDKVHLRRLFFNLIGNAVKFTPSGGTIHIRMKISSDKTQIAISDTGVGISPADLKNIFSKFYRVANTSSGESGVGLGLSIAQAIAKTHRGEITVSSEPGKGSVFTVSLPLSRSS